MPKSLQNRRPTSVPRIDTYEALAKPPFLERIPVRRREDVLIVPVQQIASIVAEGELLHLTTIQKERHTITYRLKDLEKRLDPSRFHQTRSRHAWRTST